MSNHVLRRVAIAPIRIYQQVISPLLPDACIYYPTCSQYAIQAIEKHGVLRGCWLAVRRIARCNPLHVEIGGRLRGHVRVRKRFAHFRQTF